MATSMCLLAALGLWRSTSASPPPQCGTEIQKNTGCTASKYAKNPSTSPADCCGQCASDGECVAWTFHPDQQKCYLSTSPDCRAVPGAFGGIKPVPCSPVPRPTAPKVGPLPPGVLQKPTIVTLLVDDLGFDDLRSHDVFDNTSTFTPAVDELLTTGIKLDRHHTYMWCSPTRRSFITGRFPVHVSGEQASTNSNLTPLQFTLLSEKLAAAGYSSHFIGKGHLGWATTDHLLVNRGFDTHVGYLGGSQAYKWGGGSEDPFAGKHDMWHNAGPGVDVVPEIYYSTEFYTMQAIDRIVHRNTTKPLWVHVAYQAVHGGQYREDPPFRDSLPNGSGYRNAGYGSALVSLDHGVANITATLKAEGLWDNTLLLLWADNGGDNPGGVASNYPLLGRKCLSWEGGTRVFALANGGLIPQTLRGTANGNLMHISDWYHTFSYLAGVDPSDDWMDPTTNLTHSIDGVNVWPSLIDPSTPTREWLPTTAKSILYNPAATDGGPGPKMWKLITNETQAKRFHANGSTYDDPFNACLTPVVTVFDCVNSLGRSGGGGRDSCYVCSREHPCLFDVIADPSETRNLAASNPEMVTTMLAELDKYQNPYVPELTPTQLACYNCTFNATAEWDGYVGPGCIARISQ